MGYETSLMAGSRVLLLWRKHASAEPRLLFRHDDLRVRRGSAAEQDEDRQDESRYVIEYRASAGRVLRTLEEAGLGWAATVAAYTETRQETVAGSLLHVRDMMNPGNSTEPLNFERMSGKMAAFSSIPPTTDLEALGTVLAYQWKDPDADLFFFSSMSLGGQIENTASLIFEIEDYAEKIVGLEEPLTAVRAAESWIVLHQEAPLLAWPMLVCILLSQLPSETAIILDLTDDAYENWGIEGSADADAYASDYWEWTSHGLASTARTMGRLFSVVADFDSKLGQHYWFAQSSALMARLYDLNRNRGSNTTKTRGDALEAVMNAVLKTESELEAIERNVRTREEEIDLVLSNSLSDPFWLALSSPLVLIECKNTASKIGIPALRVFESKMKDRGSICRVGIFVSLSGFTSTFYTRLKTFQFSSGIIFAVSGEDLQSVVDRKIRLTDWLRGPGLKRSVLGQT